MLDSACKTDKRRTRIGRVVVSPSQNSLRSTKGYVLLPIPNPHPLPRTVPASQFFREGEMPSISPGSTVLVTGSAGFCGAWVARALLEAGYTVRGQVHSESAGVHLRNLFERFGSSFETVVVEDLTQVSSSLLRVDLLGISCYYSGGCIQRFPGKRRRDCAHRSQPISVLRIWRWWVSCYAMCIVALD